MDKLHRLASLLRKEEFKRFQEYLDSPYFRVPKYLKDFWRGWAKVHLGKASGKIPKEKAWKKIFPDEDFNDQRWRKLKTKIAAELESFLILEQRDTKPNGLKSPLSLLQVFLERGDGDLYRKGAKKLRQQIEETFAKDERELYWRLKFWEMEYLFQRMTSSPKEAQAGGKLLDRVKKALDEVYFFEKLKNHNGLKNRVIMDQSPVPIPDAADLDEVVPHFLGSDQPLLRLHAKWHRFQSKLDEESLGVYESDLLQSSHHLSVSEQLPLFIYLINFQMRRYFDHPTDKDAKQILNVYKTALANQVISDQDGRIPSAHFQNICTLARAAGEKEFLRAFLYSDSHPIVPSERSADVLNYCFAILAFEEGDYPLAESKLKDVNQEGYLKIHIRALMAKILFRKGELNALEKHLENSIKFISRTALPDHRRLFERNRFQLMLKILRLGPGDESIVEELRKEIQSKSYHDSQWLLHFLNEK